MGEPRDLRPLFDPRSIAVVGASADVSKWGGDIACRLACNETRRTVYLVNRKGGEILGRPAYRSLSELPEAPEMVMLSMPAVAFEETLDEALAMGARALVAIFAGLGETGPAGREREREAARRIRAAGALMIGPNCMGAADTTVGFQGVAYLDVPAGHIGFISQSGAMGEEFSMRARQAGVGFSRYVSLGNQADVTIADVLRSYAGHQATWVIAVYAEELRGGREVARAAADVAAAGKPVVLLAPGRSAAGTRAARSHTGSLAPDAVVLDAVCDAAGIVRVDDPGQLFETTLGFLHTVSLAGAGVEGAPRLPAGRRVAIVTEGGGHGGVAADAAVSAGLLVPPLSPATLERVREAHPPSTGVNPVDFAIGTTDPDAYARVVPAVAGSEEVDAVLAVGQIGYWGARFAEFQDNVAAEVEGARRMARAARAARLPLLVATVYPEAPPARALREEGVPVYREIAAAARVLGRLAAAAAHAPAGVPVEPPAAPPVRPPEAALVHGRAEAGGDGAGNAGAGVAPENAAAELDMAGAALDYWQARALLAQAGLDLVPARLAHAEAPREAVDLMGVGGKPEREGLPHVRRHAATVDRLRRVAAVEHLAQEASAAAADLGYPVVVKALGVLHKSDVGGVCLDLADAAAVTSAVARMASRLGVTAVAVERMAPVSDGVELIVGCRRDPLFGPVLLVGLGGIHAELLADVRAALAPVDESRAEGLLRRLRGAPLLAGSRGRQTLDIAAAARAAAALSRFAAAHPEIVEVEANPLLVLPRGALALDARIIVDRASGRSGDAAAESGGEAVPAPGCDEGGLRGA